MQLTAPTPGELRAALDPYRDDAGAWRCPLCRGSLRIDRGRLAGCPDAGDLEQLAAQAAGAGMLDRRATA